MLHCRACVLLAENAAQEDAPKSRRAVLLGARCQAAGLVLAQRLAGSLCWELAVPTPSLRGSLKSQLGGWSHRLFFWDPVQFLWISLLFASLPPQPAHGPAALPGPPPLAQGVVWGQGMVQSQISVTDEASVNSITNFRQQPCLLFFLKRRSSLLQVQERRNKPLHCGQRLWRSLFFLTLLLTFKYSGFIALKDALCKGIFQKAEGLTVLNVCSGALGALLTKWASQRCSSTRNNRNVLAWWICGQARARTALRRLGNGRSGGMTSHVTADLRSSSFPSVFIVSERLWQTVLCQGACFLKEGQTQWRKKSKKQLWTTPQPLHTKFSRLN